jgi:hypothetical protein
MYEQVEKSKEGESRSVASSTIQNKAKLRSGFAFKDYRKQITTINEQGIDNKRAKDNGYNIIQLARTKATAKHISEHRMRWDLVKKMYKTKNSNDGQRFEVKLTKKLNQ